MNPLTNSNGIAAETATPSGRARAETTDVIERYDYLWNRATQVAQIVSAISLVFVIIQIYLTLRQIKQTNAWNRVNSTLQAFNDEYFRVIRGDMRKELATLNIDIEARGLRPLTPEQVQAIYGERDALAACKLYLNYVESFSLSVNRQVLDNDLAFNSKVLLVLKAGVVFLPLIEKIRLDRRDSRIYKELTSLCDVWERRYDRMRDSQS